MYTIATNDSLEYKQLVCGRTDDIAKLLNNISQGQSIALFGERRIGKTSVLYLVRDIINGEIDNYRSNLIDLNLKLAIDSLKAKVPHLKAVYLNLQSLSKSDPKVLAH